MEYVYVGRIITTHGIKGEIKIRSNFKYKDKVYQFMVNGQTGKIAGKTPLSIPKIIITVLAVIAVIVLLHYVGIF